MAVKPVVRYMLLCDDWQLDPGNNLGVNILGLITNIRSLDDPPYPLFYREFCVFLTMIEGRGQGEGQIVCVFEDTGQRVFETRKFSIVFGPDPLEVVGFPCRMRGCIFPFPGLYSIQFWYDGEMVEERPVRLR